MSATNLGGSKQQLHQLEALFLIVLGLRVLLDASELANLVQTMISCEGQRVIESKVWKL